MNRWSFYTQEQHGRPQNHPRCNKPLSPELRTMPRAQTHSFCLSKSMLQYKHTSFPIPATVSIGTGLLKKTKNKKNIGHSQTALLSLSISQDVTEKRLAADDSSWSCHNGVSWEPTSRSPASPRAESGGKSEISDLGSQIESSVWTFHFTFPWFIISPLF